MRKTADAGFPRAMLKLVELYARGIGEPRTPNDTPDAILQRVATNRAIDFELVADAFRSIVTRYAYGLGKPKDLVAGADWYCRSVAAGAISRRALQTHLEYVPPPPQTRAGVGLQGFPGRNSVVNLEIPEDIHANQPFMQVLSLYLKSTRNSDAESPLRLAELYLQGRDVPESPTRAWMWLQLAAERGSAAAKAKLEAQGKKMTDAELGAARTELQGLSARLHEISKTLGKD